MFLRTWQAVLLGGLVVLVAHDLHLFGWSGHSVLVDRWLYDGLELAAGAGMLARATARRGERGAWLALAAALFATTGGDILYDVAYGGDPPYPSLADVAYLAFYPLCYLGIVLLLRHRVSAFSRSLWLDGVTAGLAAGALGSSLLLEAVLAGTGGRPLVVLTNLAYPLGDIVLLALVVFVFAINGWRPSRAWSLIAAALLLNTIGDGIYLYQTAVGSYVEGTVLDAVWPASLILLAWSAWAATSHAARPVLAERSLLGTPIACGLIATAVLVGSAGYHVHPLAVGLAAATIVLVLARTALTFRENGALLALSRRESLTDALTGLGNRRRLLADLEALLAREAVGLPHLLVVFDLNGFKAYNDRFGHPAGDALLARLAGKLAEAVGTDGRTYRMGGDEFCVLVPTSETLLDRAARALAETGESFAVSSAFGAVVVPDEASTAEDALSLADQRLYAHKDQHATGRGDAHELLLRVLAEREPDLRAQVASVASLAVGVGRRLGLDGPKLEELRLAAELHDVGALAIPDAVLEKPEPLTDEERHFIRQHTLIGQRILSAVPSLRTVGLIVRSTHERWDGQGYPDRLGGEEAPLAARVIAVCSAYSAMTSSRRYRPARTSGEAIAELRRCAGTQFEPQLVELFCELAAGFPASVAPAVPVAR